ncbi:uncharacterized protein [Euphorbia lathyris]|uniref:uncharacterized protein isoform X2 n=1 Tax=Euphorbia lathyris TaxID=212925 RepID=UPI0033140252
MNSTDLTDLLIRQLRDQSLNPTANTTRISFTPDEIADWKDLSPGASRKVLHLTKKDDLELVRIGTEFLKEIKGKLSPRTIGKMFILAYNLTDSRNQAVFDDIHVDLSSPPEYQFDLEELSDDPYVTITGEPEAITVFPAELLTADRIARMKNALCYLAASYLRLYTKSAENYSRVSANLKERYISYFKTPLPIENFHPSLEAINAIKRAFEVTGHFRDTLYNLVYAGEQTDVGDSLKTYLYRTHISYTGLHPLVLFIRCMEVYEVDHIYLLNVLRKDNPEFESEKSSLARVFETFYTEEARGSKKMWKYARIFDHRFLSTLQTKYCQTFTAVLANMIHLSKAQGPNENVLNIAQIKDLPEFGKKHARAVAQRALQVIIGEKGALGRAGAPRTSRNHP